MQRARIAREFTNDLFENVFERDETAQVAASRQGGTAGVEVIGYRAPTFSVVALTIRRVDRRRA